MVVLQGKIYTFLIKESLFQTVVLQGSGLSRTNRVKLHSGSTHANTTK